MGNCEQIAAAGSPSFPPSYALSAWRKRSVARTSASAMPGSVAAWPGVGHDANAASGQALCRSHAVIGRRHHVVAALDDDARDGLQPMRLGDQLAVLSKKPRLTK